MLNIFVGMEFEELLEELGIEDLDKFTKSQQSLIRKRYKRLLQLYNIRDTIESIKDRELFDKYTVFYHLNIVSMVDVFRLHNKLKEKGILDGDE